jgi:hypothetical protein
VTTATTLAEAWDEFQQERVPIDITQEALVLVRRAYYAGALDALAIRDRRPPEPLRAEIRDFARGVIGRPIERTTR